MTTLQHRPTRGPARGTTGDSSAPRTPAAGARAPRPIAVTGLLGGLGGALGGMVVLQAIALTGWFLADGGVHGDTTDALRVGAGAWLVGHGAHLTVAGITYTVVPLGLTLVLAWAAYRAGTWAGRTAHEPADDREALLGVGLFASAYVVVAVVAAVLAGRSDARVGIVMAVAGALVVGGGAGGLGLLRGADRTSAVTDHLPPWVAPVARSAGAIVLAVLACAALLVTVSFALHLDDVMSLVSRLALRPGDTLMLAVATAAVAPNAVLFGASYLLGPGFAIGTGTTVSPSAVDLGPVPSFPLLAAVPDAAAAPWLGTVLLALPPLVAAVAVALVHRRMPARTWDVAALRGVCSGVVAGLVLALLGAIAGGALGDGRMADVGPSAPRLLISAALALGLGGLAGGLAGMLLWRRTPEEIADEIAAEEPTANLDPADPVVLVPARPDEPTVVLGDDPVDPVDKVPAAEDVVVGEVVQGDTEDTTDLTEVVGDTDTGEGEGEGFGLRELRARFEAQTRANDEDPPA